MKRKWIINGAAAIAVCGSFAFGSYSSDMTSNYLQNPRKPDANRGLTVPIQVKSIRVFVSPLEAELFNFAGWAGVVCALSFGGIAIYGFAKGGWLSTIRSEIDRQKVPRDKGTP